MTGDADEGESPGSCCEGSACGRHGRTSGHALCRRSRTRFLSLTGTARFTVISQHPINAAPAGSAVNADSEHAHAVSNGVTGGIFGRDRTALHENLRIPVVAGKPHRARPGG